MIEDLLNIAKKASEEILKIYNQDFKVNFKADGSSLTKADLRSNEIIINSLNKISSYPVITEESPIEYEKRKDFARFFLVDPLDGTKDFVAKNGEFTINIALIEKNRPILGLIYIPCSGDFYYAIKGEGAFKNEEKISNDNINKEELIASDSNFHSTQQTKDFLKKHNINIIKRFGAAIKLCKLAEGVIDLYPRFNGTSEWDTAAGDIILEEAKCKLIDFVSKKNMLYNKESFKNNYFIASRNDLNFL